MTWFAASVILAITPVAENESPISVYENVFLIEANTSEDALAKAKKFGTPSPATDEGLMINDRPAKHVFVGVRKLISISNPWPLRQEEDAPTDGTEVTYSRYEVADQEALNKLARGEEVTVQYIE